MKKIQIMLILLAIVAIFPGAANATHWEVTRADADCEAWDANFFMTWHWDPNRDVCGDVTYVVELVGENNTFTITEQETVCKAAMGVSKDYLKLWADYGLTLNGTYTATITFTLHPDYDGPGIFDDVDVIGPFTFTCAPPVDACHFTPGYWKNHAELWPVSELTLGGTTYSQAELLDIMRTPVRGDATIILAYHTIAAKLNVANGADPTMIADALVAADDVFATYGIGNRIQRSARAAALDAKDILADYNEMGCDGVASGAEKAFEPTDESTSWGGLKSLYR